MTQLILIRHGETEYNLLKRYSGIRDVELTVTGRRHAALLRDKLAAEHIDVYYSSDRKRALETAAIVFPGRHITSVADLREINFGVFEGLTHHEIMQKYKDAYVEWLKDPYTAVIPQADNLVDFQARVVGALNEIIRRHPGQTVAVVSHGGAISAYLNHVMRRRVFWEYIPKGTSVTRVECGNTEPEIKVFSDYSHITE